jgi:hypothetical protein
MRGEGEQEVFFMCSGSIPRLFPQPVVSGVEPYRRTKAEKRIRPFDLLRAGKLTAGKIVAGSGMEGTGSPSSLRFAEASVQIVLPA